ncbi:fimbrial protein [Enterobacter sp. 22325]|uniref:fimbrial protein n=1 Tax=Enterobacter sp. 22325 TaxID=3453911 RepID=UPI003F83880B
MVRRKSSRRIGCLIIKAFSLGCLLIMAGVMPLNATTDVEFSGTLVSSPCMVDTDSEDQTIDFFPIAGKYFSNNQQSYPVDISILLYDCDLTLGTQVTVTFFGEKDSIRPDLFALTGTTKGLALAITDLEAKPVLPGVSQKPLELKGINNEFRWLARLQSTAGYGAVSEGEFVSLITFQLSYE